MKDQFLRKRINALSDKELLDLLSKAKTDPANANVFELVRLEVEERNLAFDFQVPPGSILQENNRFTGDIENLQHWNWGAFILTPFWALSCKLDKWAILSLLPPINLIVAFYLGSKGNLLAFEKSELTSVDDFMEIQRGWTKRGFRVLWILIALGFIGILFNF